MSTLARRAVLAFFALVVAGAFAVEDAVPVSSETLAATVAQPPASAGSWYCPITAGDDESAVVSIASVGASESAVVVVRHQDGQPVAESPEGLGAGEQIDVTLDPGEASDPVSVRWDGGPVVVTWRVEGERTAAAPCAESPSPTWYLPGLDTADGSRSLVHLFNPFSSDAVADVSFAKPGGPVALVRTENVVVEAGRERVLDLSELIPEESVLGAAVTVRSGRLVAGAEVTYAPRAGQTGPTGRTLVAAAQESAPEWGVAYAPSTETATSYLSVLNPADQDASIEVVASAPTPGRGVFADLTVPAGGVRRVDLEGISAAPEFGVGVRTLDDVDVVVARTTMLRDGDREGITTALASPPSPVSALAGGGTSDRDAQLQVYNPTGRSAEVAVRAGPDTPPEWAALEVGPNNRIVLQLDEADDDASSLALQVRASDPVVSELRVLNTDGPLDLWSETGVSEARWRGPEVRPVLRRDEALATSPVAPLGQPMDALTSVSPSSPASTDGSQGSRAPGVIAAPPSEGGPSSDRPSSSPTSSPPPQPPSSDRPSSPGPSSPGPSSPSPSSPSPSPSPSPSSPTPSSSEPSEG